MFSKVGSRPGAAGVKSGDQTWWSGPAAKQKAAQKEVRYGGKMRWNEEKGIMEPVDHVLPSMNGDASTIREEAQITGVRTLSLKDAYGVPINDEEVEYGGRVYRTNANGDIRIVNKGYWKDKIAAHKMQRRMAAGISTWLLNSDDVDAYAILGWYYYLLQPLIDQNGNWLVQQVVPDGAASGGEGERAHRYAIEAGLLGMASWRQLVRSFIEGSSDTTGLRVRPRGQQLSKEWLAIDARPSAILAWPLGSNTYSAATNKLMYVAQHCGVAFDGPMDTEMESDFGLQISGGVKNRTVDKDGRETNPIRRAVK